VFESIDNFRNCGNRYAASKVADIADIEQEARKDFKNLGTPLGPQPNGHERGIFSFSCGGIVPLLETHNLDLVGLRPQMDNSRIVVLSVLVYMVDVKPSNYSFNEGAIFLESPKI
jgi:hypothetical protein